MNNPVGGLRKGAHDVHDNIGDTLDKYDISNYLDKSEAGQYLKKIPGFEDLLQAITDIIGFVKGVLDAIMKFIDAILDIINAIFTSIEDILKKILDLINSTLSGFGIHISHRGSILEALLFDCFSITNSKDKSNALIGIILGVLLGFTSCADGGELYSDMYNSYLNEDTITEQQQLIEDLESNITTPENVRLIDEINTDIAENRVNIILLASTLDSQITIILGEIRRLREDVSYLEAEIGKYRSGELVNKDIETLRAELLLAQENINANNSTIDSIIETLSITNSNVRSLTEERDTLIIRLEVIENTHQENSITALELENLRIERERLEEMINDINILFESIGSLAIGVAVSAEDINVGSTTLFIEDMLTTIPGTEVITNQDGIGEIILDAFETGLTSDSNMQVIDTPSVSSNEPLTQVLTDYGISINTSGKSPRLILDKEPPIIPSSAVSRVTIIKSLEINFTFNTISVNWHVLNKIIRNYPIGMIDPSIAVGTGNTTYLVNDPTTLLRVDSGKVLDLTSAFTTEEIERMLNIFKVSHVFDIGNFKVERSPLYRALINFLLYREISGPLEPSLDVAPTNELALLIL